ncbi:MAG: hypothetical protein ABH815_00300, partial [Candidatus Omnitrophota bacterium]
LSVSALNHQFYQDTRQLELRQGDGSSWQESFGIQEDAGRGMYIIRLDAFSNSRLLGSSSVTVDIPGPLIYSGSGEILSVEMEKTLYAKGESILAKAVINNNGEKIDSAALDIRVLTDVEEDI